MGGQNEGQAYNKRDRQQETEIVRDKEGQRERQKHGGTGKDMRQRYGERQTV